MSKLTLFALLAAALHGDAVAAQDAETLVRPAKVAEVIARPSVVERQYPAIVLPAREVVLSFRVSGQVIDLPVLGAMQVKAGQLIAQLDPRDFEADLARLEAQRDQSVAQLAALRAGARAEEIVALQASVRSAEAQLSQTRDQFNRTKQLADSGVVSEARLDQDQAALEVAQANLETAQEQLAIGEAGGRAEDIDAAEAALRGLEAQVQAARDNLSYTTLTAAFDGTISRRDIDNFTNVQAGQSIVLLQELSTVHLAFDVPGTDVLIWSGRDDADVSVAVDITEGPQNITSTELVEFSTQADAGTQTYRARVAVTVGNERQILPGMAGRVRVSADTDQINLPMIPLTAIGTTSDSDPIAWVVAEGTNAVQPVPITLGLVQGDLVEIEEGLAPGDRIVTAGVSKLRAGQIVRPVARIGD